LNKYFITDYWLISIPFSLFFSDTCGKVCARSEAQEKSHFRRQMAPQFREIVVQNCEKLLIKNQRKSLCAPLCLDSTKILIKFYHPTFGAGT